MSRHRPLVLTVAGLDPSGGAGLLADVKTFEQLKVYGTGVCTAWTRQNDRRFDHLAWRDWEEIEAEIRLLADMGAPVAAKIGVIPNLETLRKMTTLLRALRPRMKIVWDPVLRATAGGEFLGAVASDAFVDALATVDVVTPNWDEWRAIFPDDAPDESAAQLAAACATTVYLKGGHRPDRPGHDLLCVGDKVYPLRPRAQDPAPKHGSGCVLAAALCALLARNFPLLKAAVRSKRYVEAFLTSNETLLGWHRR